MTGLPRPCLDCGTPVLGTSRCQACAPPKTTTERGYGATHQAKRAELLAAAYGQPCTRCGRVMLPGQPLDLDHTDNRTRYRGFAHRRCNQQAGGRKGARRQASGFLQAPTMTPGQSNFQSLTVA